MPGNSPSVAFQEFIQPIRRTVSCITREPVIVSPGGRRDPIELHSVTLADGEPVILTDKGDGVTLDIGLLYVICRNPDPAGKKFKVRTRGYDYTFRDFEGTKLCAYHWHPLGEDGFHAPHFHISGTKPHYPSPRVSLESVVKSAITEFGAEPLRDDWDAVLTLNNGMFSLYSTWHDASDLAKADAKYDVPPPGSKAARAASK